MSEYDPSLFLDIVRGSETVRERWAAICERVVSDAAERGISLDVDQVLQIREARLAALGNAGGEMNPENYLAELEALPEIYESSLARRIAEDDAAARTEAVAHIISQTTVDIPEGEARHLGRNDPRQTRAAERRITMAREMGVASVPMGVADPEISRDEKLRIISELPPGQRMAQARKWGFVDG